MDAYSSINVAEAKAFAKEDEDSILQAVKDDEGGVEGVNKIVTDGLWDWAFGAIKQAIKADIEEWGGRQAGYLRERYIAILEKLGHDAEAAKVYAETTDVERESLGRALRIRHDNSGSPVHRERALEQLRLAGVE